MKSPLTSQFLGACALVFPSLLLAPAYGGELSVHFMDVGQGDGVLIIGPDGTRVLVDAGSAGKGNSSVVPYLNSVGVTGLDYSFMSHWHTDHYGGMDEVFNAGFVPSVAAYDRGNVDMPSGTQVTQYLAAVGIKRQSAFVGQTVQLGDGATLEIVAANGVTPVGSEDPSNFSQEENGRSLGMVIRYKDFDAFIAGDLTAGGSGTANIEGMAASYVGQVELVKSSHHGSKTSSSTFVVAALAPSLVIHSAGIDNQYFHPAKDIIEEWSTTGAARSQWGTTIGDSDNGSIGWTSADGAIVVKTNGYRFTASPAGSSDGANYATFENPAETPGVGDLAITEVMANPAAASDSYGEWFELVNLSPKLLDLSGVELRSGSQSFVIASHILLDYGQRFVIGTDGHAYRNGDVWQALTTPRASFNLVNSSGNLEVRSSTGVLIDAVSWGSGLAFSVKSGKSAERSDVYAPGISGNFHDATAAFGAGDRGTPAGINSPETSNFAMGLVATNAYHDDVLELHMLAPAFPSQFYGLGLSTSATTGLDALGLHLPVDPTPTFFAVLDLPGAFGPMDLQGRAQVAWPIGGDPGFIGVNLFACFVAFDGALNGLGVSNLASITIE